MRPFIKYGRVVAGLTLLALLADCSDSPYLARRYGITQDAGDAVLSDRVSQTVDPWPAASANRNVAYNGDRMEAAFTRYRTGQTIPPNGISTGTTYQSAPANPAPAAAPVGPTVTSAPVK